MIDPRRCDGLKSPINPAHPRGICRDCALRTTPPGISVQWIQPEARMVGIVWTCPNKQTESAPADTATGTDSRLLKD